MTTALWIIAICEIIRLIQNAIQLTSLRGNRKDYHTATDEFIKSLAQTDREFIQHLNAEIQKQEGEHNANGQKEIPAELDQDRDGEKSEHRMEV